MSEKIKFVKCKDCKDYANGHCGFIQRRNHLYQTLQDDWVGNYGIVGCANGEVK